MYTCSTNVAKPAYWNSASYSGGTYAQQQPTALCNCCLASSNWAWTVHKLLAFLNRAEVWCQPLPCHALSY